MAVLLVTGLSTKAVSVPIARSLKVALVSIREVQRCRDQDHLTPAPDRDLIGSAMAMGPLKTSIRPGFCQLTQIALFASEGTQGLRGRRNLLRNSGSSHQQATDFNGGLNQFQRHLCQRLALVKVR